MKKLLLLSTGGTIASVASDSGLIPRESGEGLIKMLGQLPYEIEVRDILQLDSSNIQPEEWKFIAKQIYDLRKNYDGIVVSHGTDTMAYTASMLSFMLQGIDLPVVLTGSQVPINVVLSDAPDNLRLAFAAAATCHPGIYLAFSEKVMLGCRSVKVRTTNFDAFESVNVPPVATVTSDGLVFESQQLNFPHANQCTLNTEIDPHVSLVKLFPGFDPKLLFAMVEMGCKGIVIEGYGLGGMNYIRRNMVGAIGELIKNGIPVIATSQCLYERSDLTKYEVGREALLKGAISAHDMTSESTITKLMWALGQKMNVHQVADFFKHNIVGEVSL
ncbi:asparaginase [Limosilactobacillus fastidiosus]|uniref:asparaginase n=1 Tax=Limosilactobacillus fastidiosus TaxID=2759855 RepID=A0A7W3TYD5_9LACO|nr:asparaginase [Limosilactobacillus fastidiosus]MBB1062493.1 asparaginase [Limosilactobacillus fastidiosus]MBB1085556.1 asparaginase [Limosilactobacillus fastidiosus]MCD7083567.1 asparaginase [Limosilactobacillus fastidiosus]MCD7086009.1 asparaginase [Limosilactobacillus fastidiosus]MCD7114347.1 asparaginase [Limosilactobacillus fastidiosus]